MYFVQCNSNNLYYAYITVVYRIDNIKSELVRYRYYVKYIIEFSSSQTICVNLSNFYWKTIRTR